MNSFLKSIGVNVIKVTMQVLLGSDVITKLNELVINYMDSDIPKEEKHKKVVEEIKTMGYDILNSVSTSLLDIAIKILVEKNRTIE